MLCIGYAELPKGGHHRQSALPVGHHIIIFFLFSYMPSSVQTPSEAHLYPSSRPPLACITGATSGIGQALALELYHQGYRLALFGRALEKIDLWVETNALDTARLHCYQLDVRDASACQNVFAAMMQALGVPDMVIASAGISVGVDTAQWNDLAVFDDVLRINVLGTVHTFQPFITPMRQRGNGRLVSIASMAAIRGLAGHGAYCASKSAVVAYSECLRVELHGTGVGVTCILPGFVRTPLTAGNSYTMFFLMDADVFARRAVKAIQRGKAQPIIPWQMAWVAKLLRLLPPWLFDRVFSKRGRKARRDTSVNDASSNESK